MTQWTQGYYAASAYTTNYFREQAPAMIRFCLLLDGYDSPATLEDAHCELGFGQGLTLAINAAATGGEWFGNDFMPEHVDHVRSMLTSLDGKASVSDASFQELLEYADLPRFDTISLHGIWSWVSPENRQAVLSFIDRTLKPGGAVFMSYNAMPGWSAGHPLQYLMRMHSQMMSSPAQTTPARVAAALGFVSKLASVSQGFFHETPTARAQLAKLDTKSPDYIAHEYFNEESAPMYFLQVVAEMSRARLSFGARAGVLETLEHLYFPPESLEILSGLEMPAVREQVKDYLLNRSFRRDIFVRGLRPLLPFDRERRLAETRFAALIQPAATELTIGNGGLQLNQPQLYLRVMEFLASDRFKAKTLAELMLSCGLVYQDALHVLVVLIANAAVAPCQPQYLTERASARCIRFNARLLDEAVAGRGYRYLASPLLGMGVPVSDLNQFFLAAHSRAELDPVRFVSRVLSALGRPLERDGRPINADEQVTNLRAQHEIFVKQIKPIYQSLMIIQDTQQRKKA